MEFHGRPVPEHALDELEAGAVVELLVDHRVPRDRNQPARLFWDVLSFSMM